MAVKRRPSLAQCAISGLRLLFDEQTRIVELLIERVDLQPDGIDLHLWIEGLTSLCSELRISGGTQQEAA
jgi:hypothetical protein